MPMIQLKEMKRIAIPIFAVLGAIALAAPAFAWTNPTANPATGGGALFADQNAPANSIRIKSDGNVGIGITNPTFKLHVNGGAMFNTNTDTTPLTVSRLGTDNERVTFGVTDSALNIYYKNDETTNSIVFRLHNTDTESGGGVGANDNNVMVIQGGTADNGRVGIGVPSPSFKLSVAGKIQSTSGGFRFPDGTEQVTAFAGGSQTISAANVSSGAFGANTGGGNYSFPANVGWSTSSFTLRPISATSMGVYDSAGAQVLVFDEGV